MAIHYLCDLNAPHHAANYIFGTSNHTGYESWVDTNINDFKIYNATQETYDYVSSRTFLQMSNDFSAFAFARINDCNKGIVPIYFDPSTAKPPTKEMTAKAQRASAGLLYRFLHDTGRV